MIVALVISVAVAAVVAMVVWAVRDVSRYAIEQQTERYERRDVSALEARVQAMEEQVDELHMALIGKGRR